MGELERPPFITSKVGRTAASPPLPFYPWLASSGVLFKGIVVKKVGG